MKQLSIIIACSALLFAGCSSTNNDDTKKMTCETALQAYTAYQALIASGAVDVDPQTVAYVKIAASFLGMYCGWTPVATGIVGAKDSRATVFDSNGVPILKQP